MRADAAATALASKYNVKTFWKGRPINNDRCNTIGPIWVSVMLLVLVKCEKCGRISFLICTTRVINNGQSVSVNSSTE